MRPYRTFLFKLVLVEGIKDSDSKNVISGEEKCLTVKLIAIRGIVILFKNIKLLEWFLCNIRIIIPSTVVVVTKNNCRSNSKTGR